VSEQLLEEDALKVAIAWVEKENERGKKDGSEH
jgi:hypothetical protein